MAIYLQKGAFTGATRQRLGRFELANGGTIFLDEVGELPAETQIALLRVLQEHEFERVGGNRRIRCDVRVIAATNVTCRRPSAQGPSVVICFSGSTLSEHQQLDELSRSLHGPIQGQAHHDLEHIGRIQ